MDKRKHVCLIYEFLSEQGGLEREIINHHHMLKEAGYDVTVLTCHFDKKILDQLPFDGIKIKEISRIKTPWESVNLALCFLGLNTLKKHNPDIFFSYSAPMNFLIRNKKSKKVNYVNHFPHYLYLEGKEKIEWAKGTQGIKRWIAVIVSSLLGNPMKNIDKKLVSNQNLIFMNSKFTKNKLDKLYRLKNSVVSTVPVDPKFKPSVKNLKEDFIFSSSRIIPDKKYEWLIESISLMKNSLPLYLAGSVENNYKKELTRLANKKNVKIKFLGRLNTEQIVDYYSGAKVFAFPTPQEDFGLVPAESMACGTPVVVWGDGAGPTEQVLDKITGFHAKPYDKKDFAEKIDKVIETKLKSKNQKQILKRAEKFKYAYLKKDFIKHINSIA